MKHQQVVVDYWTMLKTSCTCLLLAISGYVLIKMVQTIFYLPAYLKNNQRHLDELAAKYNLNLEKEITEEELNTKKTEESENGIVRECDEDTENSEKPNCGDDIINDTKKEPKKLK